MRVDVPTYELYGEGTDKKPDFWLHCETLYSRSSLYQFEISLHRHENFFQFLYIQDGAGNASFNGVIHSFRTPCAILVPPGFNHGFSFSRDINGHIITILRPQMPFVGDRRGGAFGAWLNEPRLVAMEDAALEDRELAAATVNRIQVEFYSRKPYKNSILESMLKTMIVLVSRHGLSGSLDEAGHPDYSDVRVEKFLELIERHFREHRPVAFYADQLGLSPTHLNRLVRRLTGETTQHMIAHKLIEVAKHDLIAMPSSVQHIAYSLGFADPAYFSRFFQNFTGETPRSFRLRERARLEESVHGN
ncbi:helix-turn-helix domain-containing protein [Brucella sp. NBRC 113783]|uniref:helix-turn-helix domain-containing protein n=1 Tax=Brucella sp. NBRC 113783 TaxID=3075478 RepID=UPI0029C0AD7F|nr:helix-turn-helix domain-containing protein [Brucella sp. NBRC 113783]MDX4073077.1 helix-turn-helix domain-containing protein [Brucella sp. NBRC 113783]